MKGVDTSCLDTAAHIVSAFTAEGKHKVFAGRVLFVGLMLWPHGTLPD